MFWQSVVALSVLACFFIVWPAIKSYRTKSRDEPILPDSESNDIASKNKRVERKTILTLVAMAAILPFLAFLLYWQLGAKPDWEIAELLQANKLNTDNQQGLIAALEKRVQQQPDNADIWYLLASTLLSSGKHEEAVSAYREVVQRKPESAQIVAEYAQALFLRSGNTITPAVREQTLQALKLNPQSPTALGLAGIDAFQSSNYEIAIETWDRAMAQLDPKSPSYRVLADGVHRAKDALANDGKLIPPKAKAELGLKVKVKLDEELLALKGATVFVYARAWQGPKIPLAIKRYGVGKLPSTIKLTESMQMVQGMGLGNFPEVEVVARVSMTGNAVPQAGDWTASIGPIVVAEQKKSVILRDFTQIE